MSEKRKNKETGMPIIRKRIHRNGKLNKALKKGKKKKSFSLENGAFYTIILKRK